MWQHIIYLGIDKTQLVKARRTFLHLIFVRKITHVVKESRLGKLSAQVVFSFQGFPSFDPKQIKRKRVPSPIFLSLPLSFSPRKKIHGGSVSSPYNGISCKCSTHTATDATLMHTLDDAERVNEPARTHKWKLKARILTRSRRLMRTRAQHPPGPGPSWNRTRAFPVYPSLVPHHSLSFARIGR